MKVLIVNTSERIGGAAIAAGRLMESLNNNGVKAKMLVRDKQTEQVTVVQLAQTKVNKLRFMWERFVIWSANRFSKDNLFAVSIANTGADITSLPEFKEADIIHLHWVNQGLLSLNDIKKIAATGKPIVWTMHDMWACTAICHHARECTKYQESCAFCPFLNNNGGSKDLSYQIFKKKQSIYREANITFVACSQWLRSLAEKSALLANKQVIDIPNPININIFKARDKKTARTSLQLPQDKKLILFGSMKITDKRKGIDYLVEACELLAKEHPEMKDKLALVVVGNQSDALKELIPFPVYSLDYVREEKAMIEIYNAVDLFVTPSLEENLPNTIMEAMACGVPCVGFRIGGIPEMIDHQKNGYVATYKSAEDFANGISWTLTQSDYSLLSKEATKKVASHYSEGVIAKRYIDIYTKLTGKDV